MPIIIIIVIIIIIIIIMRRRRRRRRREMVIAMIFHDTVLHAFMNRGGNILIFLSFESFLNLAKK